MCDQQSTAKVDLEMLFRPGRKGELNGKILDRVRFLAAELGLPELEEKFAHLKERDGAWRTSSVSDNVNLSAYIDHTLLKADASHAAIVQLCEEAKTHHFKAICVNGCHVARCAQLLAGSEVRLGCTCGFPLGQMTPSMKVAEAAEGISSGAHEVDMVINVGALKSKCYLDVFKDIKGVCDVCASAAVVSKVILETCLLSEEEIMDVCIMSVAAGATFVKTSTGFSTKGATPEAVDIMLAVVGNAASVKVSGGVRDRATAMQYVQAGVKRIGTSSGIAIVSP
ncbi:deoxyribose-phosphate aldolase, putative [Leishmania donovani]|uniref:deoxyribose-phosphate aldolase n=1 Tax=Leishmania donovani TaxID=5661 RepID=E9B8X1_LEIDO|nr:deoxyribose-phosphate aldolase, putative [Leishmania donovani]AYU76141.1 deoxyribose-phosphate aldolase, putative [Leishmania donovani]CBZ31694.1 deoxyribose-phosphate aldolase, putative [Leishmania donovani]